MTQDEALLSYRYILKLALPLILTMSSHMTMQFVDAMMLSWYSAEAVAAAIPGAMTHWMILCAFHGTASYAATFVAQFRGAQQFREISSAIWQAVYFSFFASIVMIVASLLGNFIFLHLGHEPSIAVLESKYFRILCLGSFFSLLCASFNAFFAGREDTKTILYIQIIGAAVNLLGDYLLIFGKANFPALAIEGAAIATIAGQATMALISCIIFFRKRYREDFGTWTNRKFNMPLFFRLIRFGFPSGIRYTVEMIAWTVFLIFVGRIGTTELTATNIAWRINGIAFFPVIGLAQAIAILVGKAQGSLRPDLSIRLTYRGLLLAEIWTAAAAILFLLFPRELYGLFYRASSAMNLQTFNEIKEIGVILLRFVALYVLSDSLNIIFLTSLQSAGDTRWTFIAAFIAHIVFIGSLLWADIVKAGLMVEWTIATAFVIVQGVLWLARFHLGNWKKIRLITPK